jgi:GTP-binding protein
MPDPVQPKPSSQTQLRLRQEQSSPARRAAGPVKIDTAEFLLSARRRNQFPRDGLPEVAFVGRSNVGKSSLMNRLLGRKGLARTSRTPGRTRAVNYFLINRRFYFVDLPGYGFARASRTERQRWAELMTDYFQDRPDARGRLLLQLVDGKVGATPLDLQAAVYFRSLGLEPVIVATKIDKVPRSKRARSLASIRQTLELAAGAGPVAASAVSGEGVPRLWSDISDLLAPGETSRAGGAPGQNLAGGAPA